MTTKTTRNPRARKSSKLRAPTPAKMAASVTVKVPTKQAQLIALLQGQAASTTDLATALRWLPHTTRAALTGLRKKGHAVISEKVDGETRYRIDRSA